MFKEGQRVRLIETDQCSEELGAVLSNEVDQELGGDTVIVEIDKEYRVNRCDDGLREVPVDQVEVIL